MLNNKYLNSASITYIILWLFLQINSYDLWAQYETDRTE